MRNEDRKANFLVYKVVAWAIDPIVVSDTNSDASEIHGSRVCDSHEHDEATDKTNFILYIRVL